MALGEAKGNTLSLEWALKSLGGWSCCPQIQREIIPEFRSSLPCNVLSLSVQKEAADLGHISAADHQTPEPKTNPRDDLWTSKKKGLKLDSQTHSESVQRSSVMWILVSAPVADNTQGHELRLKTFNIKSVKKQSCPHLVALCMRRRKRLKHYSHQITRSRQVIVRGDEAWWNKSQNKH